jgi:hypothetical protein
MSSTKFINEPVVEFDESGNCVPFIPISITNGRQAYAASLNIIFKHIAEFHVTVLGIIAEKHGLDINEILEEVHRDNRYTTMSKIIDNLGAFPIDEEPVPIQQMPAAEQMQVQEQVPEKKVVKKRKPKVEDEISESMTQLKLEEPKKRVYKKKAVAAEEGK